MTLRGLDHVATVVEDLDGYVDFYDEIFGARVLATESLPPALGGRMAVVEVGGGVRLHVFESRGRNFGNDGITRRGRVDHFGVQVTERSAFDRLRETLTARGCATGEVTDFGPVLNFSYVDPAGVAVDVVWPKPGGFEDYAPRTGAAAG